MTQPSQLIEMLTKVRDHFDDQIPDNFRERKAEHIKLAQMSGYVQRVMNYLEKEGNHDD